MSEGKKREERLGWMSFALTRSIGAWMAYECVRCGHEFRGPVDLEPWTVKCPCGAHLRIRIALLMDELEDWRAKHE
ncbi:MAG: hypothetical protein KAX80_07720 [Planctomycetes bacterium]|nr:hypothetical protein [Planctomycetota bacterium]